MARELLEHILETFPQADPASEFYNEEINGCEAVSFLSEFVPQVRKSLDDNQLNESKVIEVLKTCWDFIENVTDDDPERTGKFFALRERVRNIFAKHPQGPPAAALRLRRRSRHDEPSNEERADRIDTVMQAYCLTLEGRDYDGDEDDIRDLLTDLMHFCARIEIDFEENLRVARDNYDHERELESDLVPRIRKYLDSK